MSLLLEIVTPDKLVLKKEVDYVGAPGVQGEFGILPSHIPFLSALNIGELYYHIGKQNHFVFVSGGFAEIADDKVTILSEAAEEAENIDLARAKQAKQRAEERLATKAETVNQSRAEAALNRAIHRIHLVDRL